MPRKAKGRRVEAAALSYWLRMQTSALLRPIRLVAAAAVLGDAAKCALEAVEILHARLRGLGVIAKLLEARIEIGLVGPDRRKRGGVAAGLGVLREQTDHLGGRIDIDGQDALRLGLIVGHVALRHSAAGFGLRAH